MNFYIWYAMMFGGGLVLVELGRWGWRSYLRRNSMAGRYQRAASERSKLNYNGAAMWHEVEQKYLEGVE